VQLFVNILGYTLNPHSNYNLTTEFKNEKGAKKADGGLLKDGKALAVIELKGTKTKDLESIRQQAFGYKDYQSACVYVITSNFEKIRFYINNAIDYEDFNLFTLREDEFALLYLCLHKDNILNNIPLQIKNDSLVSEEKITKKLYADYSLFKRELFRDLVKLNMKNEVFRAELEKEDKERASKNIKLTIFRKSQKLIDRFLFIFFAEDRGLLPPNSTLKILEQWDTLKDLDTGIPLYNRYKKYFSYLDTGRKRTATGAEIFAYNGGLFKPDPILDSLLLSDDLLYRHTEKLSNYDFESQVDVNILGHIFENSLNEIESVNAEIEGVEFDKQKTKRKKDGVFYTPKYITKYIIDNTIGKLCLDKKQELGFVEEEYLKSAKGRRKATLEGLGDVLNTYREWLLSLTILDPACGSGAFLNQAIDFLIKEHQFIDELQASLFGQSIVFQDIENTILENNIYGVDLNEESVEIAKLSLWLRTAQPRRKLNSLNNNIKCGNSLIDSKTVAGNKAFNWEEEFPSVFANGGFDVVVGNPPYGDYFNIDEKNFLLKKYKNSFSGTFDMYITFFDVALQILKPNRKLCFITPNTFIEYSQFSALRELLMNNNAIEQVISLTNVFEDAIVDTAIILLTKDKEQSETFKGLKIKNKIADLDNVNIPSLNAQNLTSSGFILKYSAGFDVQKMLSKHETKLKDVLKITQGITTGGNKAFLNSKEHFVINDIPKHIVKKVLKGKTINRYKILYDNQYILYSIKSTEEEAQSKIIDLLEPFQQKLANKRETKQGKLPWYCLHWARDAKDFNEPKILIRQTASHIIATLDTENYYPIDTIHTLNLKVNVADKVNTLNFFLALLNSKLFRYLYHWKLDEGGKVYPQIKKVNIEWLPIVECDDSNSLLEKTIEIQDAINKLEIVRVKFLKYLKSKYESISSSSIMKKWHEIFFDDFIKELNKAIKKEGGKKLTKIEEMDWMEVFENKKTEAEVLKAEIEQIDNQIDQMVYELYDLTPEEIETVENS
jgi:tRNA1(Val) A37 N6-methylase TrmN6